MNHDELKEKILEIDDPGLSRPDREELLLHISTCGECRSTFEYWKKIRSVFFRTPEPPSSEIFVQKVMAKVRQVEKPGQIGWQWTRWMIPAVTGFALAGFALFLSYPLQSAHSSLEPLFTTNPFSTVENFQANTDESLAEYLTGGFQ